ncbi:protein flightless-1 isoform X2 [Eurytemora carolleeae]|uniref:protein flightless-1 isoform X2 n=1 Tax=Eurytemora carolleeae TaxID=1294199 RepID=UPI000C77FF28|nr:protein flightless-1 isoform X2 [Eurytemora carolleeae]|eukprot:XP_023344300.1 protein flightless-1-like isoform X2 [Eurytemora affinis]
MASTGVLPFIRGIDLTMNDLQDDKFPEAMEDMTSLRWLKLNNANLTKIPDELGKLVKLEHLTIKRNNLESLSSQLSNMHCLRTLNLRYNNLTHTNIPVEVFENEELSTLDLSHNQLQQIPEGLLRCRSLLVLNLSHNQIEMVPSQLFMATADLLHLDLANNELDALPPQLRRLGNLQTLVLSNNPLSHFQIRPLPALTELRTLHLRNTQRTLSNIPVNLEPLVHLADVDLSQNHLTKIPEGLLVISGLKRLNLGSNMIDEVSPGIERWNQLETLILSRNKITSLPGSLCKLFKLKKLYVCENQLDFEGIPAGIGKLSCLEIFSAADNNLEMIREGLCRCASLKKLILARNKLITLPDAIHLTELQVLDLKGNPELIMPPKPTELMRGAGAEFYNIDFSLQNQLRLAGASVPPDLQDQRQEKDPVARKMRLRRRRGDAGEADEDQKKVLKGMTDVALEREAGVLDESAESIKAKKWDEALEKPALDYSEFFDSDVGSFPGLSIWEIENFYPNQVDESVHGKFYEGDCYIVLHTFLDENQSLDWGIYFWIGEKATLDKRTCSAMHSVNLRNYLGANCRTIREEQGDESEEFLKIFGPNLTYVQGQRTASGFYTVEEVEYTVRLYRIHEAANGIHLEGVAAEFQSLDTRYVFLLDAGLRIMVWYGKNCKNVLKSKARLMAERINKNERKGKAGIHIFCQGDEPGIFWQSLVEFADEDSYPEGPIVDSVPEDFKPLVPRLYTVGLGMGYLELPQVEIPGNKLKQEHLNTKNVYILDCYSDLFVWVGKKSTRLVRVAALKLSSELFSMLIRPEYAMIHSQSEGTESQVFKTKFIGWDDVIGVDFTRTAQSVQRTGADLQKWAKQQETKIDLSALFQPRQPSMSKEEAQRFAEDWNEDLEKMEAFVFEGKKFVKLPEEEKGIFHSRDSYVFLCRYWAPGESENPEEDEDEGEDDYQCVVYFWQGRESSNMGWLTFTFSLQKKFESLFGEKLEVVRMHQQQENLKFMSHFNNGLLIKQGCRKEVRGPGWKPESEFYQLRSNGSSLYRRCIQLKTDSSLLNSCFSYILKVPFDAEDKSGIVYVWIGSKCDPDNP